jgi:multicomponent Na+:H+ antiporter subunit A
MFEAVLGSALSADIAGAIVATLAVAAAMMGVAVAGILGLKPFWGELAETPKAPHEAPISMLLGPIVLASLSLVFGVAPFLLDKVLVQAAVPAVYGESFDFYLSLWHGVNAALLLSGLSLAVGAVLYWQWDRVRAVMNHLQWLYDHGPEWIYHLLMDRALPWVAYHQTRIIQNGYLRNYVITILLTLVVLVGYSFLTRFEGSLAFVLHIEFYHLLLAMLLVAAAVFASVTRSRLGSVVATGVVGFSVALIYILFGAPDLAITQMLVETLTVILLVLVLFRLPEFVTFSSRLVRARDFLVALLVGTMMTVLLLATGQEQFFDQSISAQHLEASVPLAHGRNVVNVILVDYRAFDTLGESFVLALAAMGVYAMIKFRAGGDE